MRTDLWKLPSRFLSSKSGLLESGKCNCKGGACSSFNNLFYGASASKHEEPLEQVAAFLVAKELQNSNSNFKFFPLAVENAGLLNAKRDASLADAVRDLRIRGARKQWLHSAIMEHFEINGEVLLVDHFWDDPLHWEIAEELLDNHPEIVPQKNPFIGKFRKFKELASLFRHSISPGLVSKIGEIDSPRLYTLVEVAYLRYLKQRYGIDSKLGPVTERHFDNYISGFMDVAHFKQPVDLDTTPNRIKTLSPYIAYSTENRVFLSDGKEELARKLAHAEEVSATEPHEYHDNGTESKIFSPILQHAVYAVEAKRLLARGKSELAGKKVSCGLDAVELADQEGVAGWGTCVASLFWDNIVEPIGALMKTKWDFESALAEAKAKKKETLAKLKQADRKLSEGFSSGTAKKAGTHG